MINSVEEILAAAKQLPRKPRVVVEGAGYPTVLEAVCLAKVQGICEAILVGDKGQIEASAKQAELDISPFPIHHVSDPDRVVEESMRLIEEGRGDFPMKGKVMTHQVIRGMLDKRFSLRTGHLLCHVAVFNVPGEKRIMLLSDCGVVIQPDLEKKKTILRNTVHVAHALGLECPKAALLSFIEEVTDPSIAALADAAQITRLNQSGEISGCIVEGPYSLDVAMSPEAAKIKGAKGQVAGRADILIMSDLGMGNVLYKSLMLWPKPTAASVIVGARVPIAFSSRSESVENRVNCLALAALLWSRGAKG